MSKPVAYVTGYYQGHCVIQPTDPAVVLPVGMALHRAPTDWVELTDVELKQTNVGIGERGMQKRGWVGLTVNEAREFYESELSREDVIYKIDEFLEEKNT